MFSAIRLLDENLRYGSPWREAEDDLESFLNVLVFNAVQYINSNLQDVAAFIQRYFFKDRIMNESHGSYRVRCVLEGRIRISKVPSAGELQFALPAGAAGRSMRRPRYTHPINGVIQQMLSWIWARDDAMPNRWEYTVERPDNGHKVFTGQQVINLLDAALQDSRWPAGDQCDDRWPEEYWPKRITRNEVRRVLPDDVRRERPDVELPAAKRRRVA